MPVSAEYCAYALDQLASLGRVTGTRMFGGVGIYLNGVFFALIADDVVYFKVGDSNRAEYESAGMKPFKPYRNKNTTMPFFEVPVSVLEDVDQLAAWGRKAYAVARRSR
jgi:DNA transformation protein